MNIDNQFKGNVCIVLGITLLSIALAPLFKYILMIIGAILLISYGMNLRGISTAQFLFRLWGNRFYFR